MALPSFLFSKQVPCIYIKIFSIELIVRNLLNPGRSVATLAYDPDAFLFAIALAFAIMALLVVFTIYLSERFKEKASTYVSSLPVRIGALIIDITVIRCIVELVLIIFNPGYVSIFAALFTNYSVHPIIKLLVIIEISLNSYLFFYHPMFLMPYYFTSSVLIAIFGFLYFFLCDAFIEGGTVGRLILRLRTIHESRRRHLSVREAAVNALGKTFILIDLGIGVLASICYSKSPGLRQVRLTQRLSGAVTVSSSFNYHTYQEGSESFLRDDNLDGAIW